MLFNISNCAFFNAAYHANPGAEKWARLTLYMSIHLLLHLQISNMSANNHGSFWKYNLWYLLIFVFPDFIVFNSNIFYV